LFSEKSIQVVAFNSLPNHQRLRRSRSAPAHEAGQVWVFWQILSYGDFLAAEVGFQLKQILQVEE
jgi:hypothetical protein